MTNLDTKGKEKVRLLAIVLSISIVLLTIKFIAWYLTRSNAILTDALESIVNVVAGAFALFSIYYASQPKDENHPYGHGKIEFLSAGFEGGLIFIAGISIIGNSVYSAFLPPKIKEPETGAWLSALSGGINYIMGWYLVSTGRKTGSLLMTANGKHLISDTVSSIGLVAGLLLIWLTGWYWIDLVMAIIFGFVILVTGYGILKKSVTSLLDEADVEKLNLLIQEMQKHRRDQWIDIHNLRVIKYGTELHVDCHITLPWYGSLEETHHEVSSVENLIKDSLGKDVEFFIHADPCVPPKSCAVCQLSNCNERKSVFTGRVDWTLSNMLPNQKHGHGND
jgi:cation diffusion facilitator family transporter